MDDSLDPVIHAAGVTAQDALDLSRGHGHAHHAADLFADLIDAADHAQLQAAAGGGVGNAVVQPHQIHRPAPDVRHDDGRFVQQTALGQHGCIALGEQFYITDGHRVLISLIAEQDRSAVPQQVLPELLFIPAKAGEGETGSQQDCGRPLRVSILQFFGDGCQRQQVVVHGLGLVFLKGLASTAYHIVPALIFQNILLGVRLMLICNQAGGKRKVGRFHSGIPMIHANGDNIAHLLSPPFLSFFFFEAFSAA